MMEHLFITKISNILISSDFIQSESIDLEVLLFYYILWTM